MIGNALSAPHNREATMYERTVLFDSAMIKHTGKRKTTRIGMINKRLIINNFLLFFKKSVMSYRKS